jgi:4'-phosphopantetheinyl transferase
VDAHCGGRRLWLYRFGFDELSERFTIMGSTNLSPPVPGLDIDSAMRLLPRGEVHVWFASLGQPPQAVQDSESLLSSEERVRAEQFHFDRDRQRFIAARSLLRTILREYLGAPPASFLFRYGAAGKPALSGCWAGALEFNLAHSSEGVVYALARDRRVGVDMERIRPLDDLHEMALRVLSEQEQVELGRATPSQKLRAFYEFWTRKEAFIKATGDGFSFPVHRIDVSLPSGKSTRLLGPNGDGGGKPTWTLRALAPDPAYAAALVVEGDACDLHCRRWPLT